LTDHDIFVSAERPADEVRAVIEAELRTPFTASDDPHPVPALVTATTKVFFYHSHRFEDDRDFAVSRYRYWINVHDATRDEQRQLAVAQQIFDAVKAQTWPFMLTFNLQGSLAVYP
jgi:hypothetical protein